MAVVPNKVRRSIPTWTTKSLTVRRRLRRPFVLQAVWGLCPPRQIVDPPSTAPWDTRRMGPSPAQTMVYLISARRIVSAQLRTLYVSGICSNPRQLGLSFQCQRINPVPLLLLVLLDPRCHTIRCLRLLLRHWKTLSMYQKSMRLIPATVIPVMDVVVMRQTNL